jgi:hypothetical protein
MPRKKKNGTLKEQVAALEALSDAEARATNGGVLPRRRMKPLRGSGGLMIVRGSGAVVASGSGAIAPPHYGPRS